jgi:hypothetical protein
VELPNLRSVLMGKQMGSWTPLSMFLMMDFSTKLMKRHPKRTVLRMSCLGHNAAPSDDD